MTDLFKKLKELNFPEGEYVVVGGALMARGIREERDLDILVTPNFYQELLKDKRFKQCICEMCLKTSRLILKGDGVDILPNFIFGKYTGDTRKLIKSAEIINGYPFIKLTEYIKFKKELYVQIGKPKYIQDVKLMEDYLERKK